MQSLRGIASKDMIGELEMRILALAKVPFLSRYVIRSPMPHSGCSAGFLRKESLSPRGRTAPVRRLNALRCRGMRMFPKEPQHFSSSIGAARIGVGAHCATAKPGVTSAVDNPLLNDRPLVRVFIQRSTECMAARNLALLNMWLKRGGLPRLRHDRMAVLRIDRGIPVAMKHNSRNDPSQCAASAMCAAIVPSLHSRECGSHVPGRPARESRMYADRSVKIRIRVAHDRRRCPAG